MKVVTNSLKTDVHWIAVRKVSAIRTCLTLSPAMSYDYGKDRDGADYTPSHQGLLFRVRDCSFTRGETGDWSSLLPELARSLAR